MTTPDNTEYTPTTRSVRNAYGLGGEVDMRTGAFAAFDRWFAPYAAALEAAQSAPVQEMTTSEHADLIADATGIAAFQGYGSEKGIEVFKRMMVALASTPSPVQGADDENIASIAQVVADSVFGMQSGEYVAGAGTVESGDMQIAYDLHKAGFSRRSPSVASSGADDRLAQAEAALLLIAQSAERNASSFASEHATETLQILATCRQSPQAALNEVRAEALEDAADDGKLMLAFIDYCFERGDTRSSDIAEGTARALRARAAELRATPQPSDD